MGLFAVTGVERDLLITELPITMFLLFSKGNRPYKMKGFNIKVF